MSTGRSRSKQRKANKDEKADRAVAVAARGVVEGPRSPAPASRQPPAPSLEALGPEKPIRPGPPEMTSLAPLPVLDLAGLRALTPADFSVWCAALLARFGYTVRGEPGSRADGGHLELSRGGETILVDCIAFSERENVGRPEGQRLIDAMEQRQIARGILLTPGSFENGCRSLAQQSATGSLQLIDGERLELTAREIATGPLAAWWS